MMSGVSCVLNQSNMLKTVREGSRREVLSRLSPEKKNK